VVVKGEPPGRSDELVDIEPAGVGGVETGDRFGRIGHQRQVRHADDPPSGIACRVAVGGQLLQMATHVPQARLLAELSDRGIGQVLVHQHKATGQGQPALGWCDPPTHAKHLQHVGVHGEDHEVDGD
jgi:hypothetical protein